MLLIKNLFTLCFFLSFPVALFSQKPDTVTDSHQTWALLQQRLLSYYKDSASGKLLWYQKQAAIQLINEKLTLVNVAYISDDGRVHNGQIICNKAVAQDIEEIFSGLLQLKFPIHQCKPISDYGFTDVKSMQANNTSGFDYRLKTGSRALSKHAYGLAIDINPVENPYKKGEEVLPYNNKENIAIGRIRMSDEMGKKVVSLFAKRGWIWGGSWRSLKDYMHFEKR